MVYALRLQHLEECLNFSERLEKVTKSCVGQGGLVWAPRGVALGPRT